MRVRSGVEGLDDLVGGGFPTGSCVILQGPPGNEKDEIALRFLAEGLQAKEAAIAVVSSTSPEQFLESLSRAGADVEAAMAEHRLRIVDWYSRQRENVFGVEERGAVIRCSVDLTDASIAISRAIAGLAPRVARRGLFEILSPSLRIHNANQVYEFAQNVKAKLAPHKVTSIFLFERDMHEPEIVSSVCQPFDGVIDITREQDAEAVRRKIVVLWLKDTVPNPKVHALEITPGKGPAVVLHTAQQTPSTAKPSERQERTEAPQPKQAPPSRSGERSSGVKTVPKERPLGEGELAHDRCPNCGRPLKFEEGQTEGYCANCSIYVEVLKDLPAPPAQEVRKLIRAEIQNAKRHELEMLCRESGLKLSGSRDDLAQRLLRYLDRGGPDVGQEEGGRRTGKKSSGSSSEPELAIGKRELILFLLSLGVSRKAAGSITRFYGTYARFLDGDSSDIGLFSGLRKEEAERIRAAMKPLTARPPRGKGPAKGSTPSVSPAPAPSLPSEPAVAAHVKGTILAPEPVRRREPAPPPPRESPPPPPPPKEWVLLPPPSEPLPPPPPEEPLPPPPPKESIPPPPPRESSPAPPPPKEPPPAPTLKASLPPQPPVDTVGEALKTLAPWLPPSVREKPEPVEQLEPELVRRRWSRRAIYYVGVLLVAGGGPGLLLGSFLHDSFRVPVVGAQFEGFGWLNTSAAVVGAMLLVIGLGSIRLALKPQSLRTRLAQGG